MEAPVNRKWILTTAVLLCLGFAASVVFAQQPAKTIKQQIVGTWSFVKTEATHPDGTKTLAFGPTPKGILIFTEAGDFAHIQIADGIPKFASNSRVTGTAEENKAVVQGSISLLGTYTVNDAAKSFSRKIESGTFPNWIGQEQKLKIDSLTADELIYSNAAGSIAGVTTVNIWKRAK
jgi:hypothetical protein